MLTPRKKLPSTGGSEEGGTRDAASNRIASPTHYRLCYSGPEAEPPRWPSGKASVWRAEDPGFESRLRRDFVGVELYQ